MKVQVILDEDGVNDIHHSSTVEWILSDDSPYSFIQKWPGAYCQRAASRGRLIAGDSFFFHPWFRV